LTPQQEQKLKDARKKAAIRRITQWKADQMADPIYAAVLKEQNRLVQQRHAEKISILSI